MVIQTISGKTVVGFTINAWGPVVISYDQNQKNGCLENYICVRVFKHRPVPIDQVFCTHYVLCLLQSWRIQLTTLPGQIRQRAQNTQQIMSLTCSFKHAHLCINTNAMCFRALCSKKEYDF